MVLNLNVYWTLGYFIFVGSLDYFCRPALPKQNAFADSFTALQYNMAESEAFIFDDRAAYVYENGAEIFCCDSLNGITAITSLLDLTHSVV